MRVFIVCTMFKCTVTIQFEVCAYIMICIVHLDYITQSTMAVDSPLSVDWLYIIIYHYINHNMLAAVKRFHPASELNVSLYSIICT